MEHIFCEHRSQHEVVMKEVCNTMQKVYPNYGLHIVLIVMHWVRLHMKKSNKNCIPTSHTWNPIFFATVAARRVCSKQNFLSRCNYHSLFCLFMGFVTSLMTLGNNCTGNNCSLLLSKTVFPTTKYFWGNLELWCGGATEP